MSTDRSDRIVQIIGLGDEAGDGHLRVTEGEGFRVLLGSEQSHDAMSELCARISAQLKAEGRTLEDLSEEEFIDLLARIDGSSET